MKNTHLQLRMNADVERGGIRTRQVTEDAALGGMDLQLVPFEMYDYARAKIAANLSWLFSKAFGTDGVPSDLQDPFYTDQYEQEHIKPPIIHLLLSSELYCIVCGRLLQPQHAATLQNHTSVLQVLSKKGIYVVDENNTLISELDLTSAPIKMDSHIHLIDALMMAYTDEMISIEKVLCAVEYFSETSDSADVPLDIEAAMILWINKIITKLKEFTQTKLKVNHLLESPGHQKVHHRKDRLYERSHQHLSMLDSLSSFVCNGTALLAVVHFYCHDLMKLQDICWKEVPSINESLHNIELLRKFSDEFLNKCFHLSPEDMLYSPPVLKSNMMQYIAELFWTFEIVKPDFMQPMDISEIKDARVSLHHQSPSSQKHTFWSSKNTVSSSEISFKTRLNSFALPRCKKELKEMKGNSSGQRDWSNSIKQSSGQQTSHLEWSRNKPRSLSETAPNAVNFSTKEDGNVICVTRSLHSLSNQRASNFMNNTPSYLLGSGHPRRLSGQSLLNHIRFEDEEEEIEEEELVAIIDPSTLPRRQHQCKTEHKDLNCTRLSSTESSLHRYYVEPLMPALRKPAKEKSVNVKKEEECGESDTKQAVRRICRGSGAALISNSKYMSNIGLPSLKATTQDSSGVSLQDRSKQFYVHMMERTKDDYSSSLEASNDYDSDIENFPEDSENELQLVGNMLQSQERNNRKEQRNFAEGESAKLGQDLSMNEWDDKEDHSRCSSPCTSTDSRSSSCNTPTGTVVKMTSFAEKRRLKSGRDGLLNSSITPKTTPDGSETVPWPPLKLKNSYSLDKELCSLSRSNVTVPSEFLELHMELEERRHAIECHKKRMEALSAQQRLKLGKAAFLNIVKKGPGSSGTLPLPVKQEASALTACGKSNVKVESCKDDSCLEALKKISDNKLVQESGQDLNVCSQSIEVINEAIISIQQQIMQLSQKQDILIKHSSPFPCKLQIETNASPTANLSLESTAIVNVGDESGLFPCEPKFCSNAQKASNSNSAFSQILHSKEVKQENIENCKTDDDKVVNFTSEDFDVIVNVVKTQHAPIASMIRENASSTAAQEQSKCETHTFDSGTMLLDYPNKSPRMKAQLIEVDFSEMRKPIEHSCTEDKLKTVLGFFFKDEDRADEMAKRRAAFLTKQQRKAEEAKLRKQHQEAESELKRDEARRKAEEERIRKEEEKARREFIKQEYLRKKQQMLVEAQGLVESLPRTRSRKSRPKSLHREGPSSLFKGTTTPDLCESRRGSTLSLATEAESVISVESQRAGSVCSMDLPVLSRASSRNMERDWENGSIASSITSTEYTGPKLYKEPSAKSNKPIIINAIAHCCLAGKVNEIQKNAILEELDKCESNHLIILFRDGGCQFRAIYSYSPDTEEITKVSGTGPRSITQKMIDKLYKYSSDRKQFSVIPAKCVSVSIDALTIHNHLWHVRRPGSARRK